MKGCQKAHSTGCSFIDFDAACLTGLPKLILVFQKAKPSQKQKQNAQLWNHTCEVMACSLQDDGF